MRNIFPLLPGGWMIKWWTWSLPNWLERSRTLTPTPNTWPRPSWSRKPQISLWLSSDPPSLLLHGKSLFLWVSRVFALHLLTSRVANFFVLLQGWVDNWNGPSGIYVAVSLPLLLVFPAAVITLMLMLTNRRGKGFCALCSASLVGWPTSFRWTSLWTSWLQLPGTQWSTNQWTMLRFTSWPLVPSTPSRGERCKQRSPSTSGVTP